jgi:Protein of unknown function (Hypoth_ymh)
MSPLPLLAPCFSTVTAGAVARADAPEVTVLQAAPVKTITTAAAAAATACGALPRREPAARHETALSPIAQLRPSSQVQFDEHRAQLNEKLLFSGLKVREDGKVVREARAATTVAEAQQRANDLRAELTRRDVHPDVLRFCRAELLQQNYFHAVLEASKSVADKLRTKTGEMVMARPWLMPHARSSQGHGSPSTVSPLSGSVRSRPA